MAKKRSVLVGIVALILLVFVVPSLAQTTGDSDGDGVSNRIDRCPTVPGPASNGGCPLPATTPPNTGAPSDNGSIPDKDSDGVADYVDQCPEQAGTGFTEGCPVEVAPDVPAVAQPIVPQAVMIWESTTDCRVGVPPTSSTSINIREQPTTNSAIIGHLVPGQQFAPFFRDYDENDAIWFGGAPAGGDSWGWVAGSVVIDNGQCASLPIIAYVDAPSGVTELVLPPDIDQLDPGASDATPVPLSDIDWGTLMGTLDRVLVVRGGEDGAPTGKPVRYMEFKLKEVYITGVGPPSGGGGNPPAPQPTAAPSPARPLPILLVIADMQDSDCAPIGTGQCLLMALRLPDYGDQPGQCPASGDETGQKPRRTPTPAPSGGSSSHGTHLPEVVIELWRAASPASHPGAGNLTPQVMLSGDGSVMPVEQNDSSAHWDYACAVIGFVPTGETQAMGDGSVRFRVDTIVVLPAVQ